MDWFGEEKQAGGPLHRDQERGRGPVHRVVVVIVVAVCGVMGEVRAADEIVMSRALVVGAVGTAGRSAVHTDAVEAAIVAGTWRVPTAGDVVTLPGGRTEAWAEREAGEDGWIAAPGAGYACWVVESKRARTAILSARGHGMVYVNGEPRVGDPYENGYVRVPVVLREGSNWFLFRGGRGRVRAALEEPRADVYVTAEDATVPDLIREERGAACPSGSNLGAVMVVSATAEERAGLWVVVEAPGGDRTVTAAPALLPMSVRKARFEVPRVRGEVGEAVEIRVWLEGEGERVGEPVVLRLNVREADRHHKRTFVSGIDGSVQYYAVVPPKPGADPTREGVPEARPTLVLTLHGASVEATGQAAAYGAKPGMYIVAPTNRRPYGFDWEDWGRLDALEVMGEATRRFDIDPRRVYLTGHSMGGHGAWQIGAHYPDRFAAIAPSAGWVSFRSYTGADAMGGESAVEKVLRRAASASDALAVSRNFARLGVYVLHGDADDNVPVREARSMRSRLGEFHPDFAYHERAGAGHWWGNECVDWPAIFEFFARRTLPAADAGERVDFTTASPGVSARCDWAVVWRQAEMMSPSRVVLEFDAGARRVKGETANVAVLAIDTKRLPGNGAVSCEIDGEDVSGLVAGEDGLVFLSRGGGGWRGVARPSAAGKSPERCGPFKSAFSNRMVLVYGTLGTEEENAWAAAKTRYDAETFWYRGNGSVDVMPDWAFGEGAAAGRNVVLYGNERTNAAWGVVLADSPVRIEPGRVTVGARVMEGDDLACLFVRPRAGSERAMVAVVGGTGARGMRLTDRVPYFVSGVGLPDWIVLGPETLERGVEGVRGAGFFDGEWGVGEGEE